MGAFPAIASNSEQLTAPVNGTLDSLAQRNAEPGNSGISMDGLVAGETPKNEETYPLLNGKAGKSTQKIPWVGIYMLYDIVPRRVLLQTLRRMCDFWGA